MTRQRLPDRRPSVNLAVTWSTLESQHHFTLTVGYHPETGRISEVFYADGQREGSAMQHTVQDACVVISLALQRGVLPSELAHSLGRMPVYGTDGPASPIGAIVDALEGL